ncbi:MAG TPA: phosphate ABC transporter substrate-binding protein PstS [Gemmatimonadaceae bacterium]
MRITAFVLSAALLAACSTDTHRGSDSAGARPTSGGSVDLTGAGATFPYPIYSKWFADYASQKGVKINYQSIGSGGGIRQLSEQTVDFGASDAPMKDDELAKAKGGAILHVPTVIGAVALTYNLPELKQPLKLDGATVADIYLGTIKKWNDSRIAALNGGVPLPNTDILVVHRSDGSGTSYIFTDYLASVSPAWKSGPGVGKEVQWPTGIGAKGNEGVAGQIKQTPGAIGYAELAYAKQNSLPVAALRNSAGEFVTPSLQSATAAAAGAVSTLPANTDYRISIVNAKGAGAYPIASFTWILVYQNQTDAAKGKKLVDFLTWALTEGEKEASSLDYAPLPEAMSRQIVDRLKTIKVGAGA